MDAQLSPRLVARFEDAGHEAVHVFDHLNPQADDLAVAELAISWVQRSSARPQTSPPWQCADC